jgi:exosortase D (VPLPA-CTERM-specific)
MTATYSTTSGDGLHPGHGRPALLTTRLLAAGLVTLCVALACYTARDGLLNLYDRWRYEEEYGYGFLIAALMPVLLWRRWHALVTEPVGARWPGVGIVAIAQLCTILGVLGESYFIEQLALVVSIFGIALVVFGAGAVRIIFPIVLLLLLTIPLPYTLEAMLTIKLQLVSTNVGVAIIQLLGIPVYVEGNIIDLGSYKLQVAEACSGLRYLLPLTCISFLMAYLYKAPFWKKAVVVISAAPLTVLLNSIRIAVTAVLVNNFGSKMAEGFLHEFEGWIVFLLGVLLLGLVICVLEGFRWSEIEIESIMDRPRTAGRKFIHTNILLPLMLAISVCASTLGVATSIASAHQSMPNLVRENFAAFPRQIEGWSVQPAQLEPDILNALKATDTYNGDFIEGHGIPSINLFVAYYDSLSKGAAIHSPRVCLPGAGWEFAAFEQRDFRELESDVAGSYNYVLIQKGEQKILMYYWYQQRNRRTADEFTMKYYLLVDSFFKSRKDGALVRLFTPIDPAAGEKALSEADARLRAFARAVFSRMPSYLPQ